MKKRILTSLAIVFVIVLLDQGTKYLARTSISPYEAVPLMPFINLVNVRNEGAAFGMFRSLGNSFFIVISMAAIVFMSWIVVKDREDHRVFSMLAGGAAGNLIDRLTLGYVVDFIDVSFQGHHWPAFNVADSALSVGMVLMAVNLLRGKK